MQEGDIAIAFIQQSDGSRKHRPVLLLRQMPGRFAAAVWRYVVCGISTQLRQAVPGFDEVLTPEADNQLRAAFVIRLPNLIALSVSDIDRVIEFIPPTIHTDLLQRLANHFTTH